MIHMIICTMKKLFFNLFIFKQYNRRKIHVNIVDRHSRMKETSPALNLQRALLVVAEKRFTLRLIISRRAKTRTRRRDPGLLQRRKVWFIPLAHTHTNTRTRAHRSVIIPDSTIYVWANLFLKCNFARVSS